MLSLRLMLATGAAALASVAFMMPAEAAVEFTLKDVTFNDGGTASGTFTTSDNFSSLLGYSITTSAGHLYAFGNPNLASSSYAGKTYSSSSTDFGSFFTTAPLRNRLWSFNLNSGGSSLYFIFDPALSSAAGTQLSLASSESAGFFRYVTRGEVVASSVNAVPEPASWAMMVGGFGLLGAALRRRRTTTVSFV